MIDYTEKELLMLSNFVYLPASQEEGTIGEIVKRYSETDGNYTAQSVAGAGTGGGLDNDQVSQLFTLMSEECDRNPDFADLSPARALEEKDVRGICYTNSKDQNPVIVFRGTGGTAEAWQDNMYGGFRNDTRIQKLANDFVKYECGVYEDCVVTGHSKGGNLSQYVTVMNSDKISRCVSFDGQGMNKDFISRYSDKIAASSGKIKSISAYNDFVNILLTCIAGEAVYVNNKKSGANAHSSFYLLDSNEYDKDGNFVSLREQSPITEALDKATDKITDILGIRDHTDNIILGGILGEAIATVLSAKDIDQFGSGAKSTINKALMAFSLKMKTLFDDEDAEVKMLPTGGVYFDQKSILCVADSFDTNIGITSRLIEQTETIKNSIDYDIASKFYTETALTRVVENMSELRNSMNYIKNVIYEASASYEKRETEIVADISTSLQRI